MSTLGKVQRSASLWLTGELALYCVGELSEVEVLEGAWHTVSNRARPQTCVAEVDVDADD